MKMYVILKIFKNDGEVTIEGERLFSSDETEEIKESVINSCQECFIDTISYGLTGAKPVDFFERFKNKMLDFSKKFSDISTMCDETNSEDIKSVKFELSDNFEILVNEVINY